MRRTVGPILTTGVALSAAAVIVANPIIAPRSDLQIPAVQLSAGTGDAISMLDKAFLDAIAPAPPDSTNPLSILKQLVRSLAADASYMGKNAIVDAFVAGVAAVSEPELTATANPGPFLAPLTQSPELAMSLLPGLDLTSIVPVYGAGPSLPRIASTVGETIAPAVKSFVGGLVSDVNYAGGELVAAAFATGAMVANEPRLILDTLKALVRGDLSGALQSAVKAVIAPFGPPVIIFNAVETLIEKHLSGVTGILPPVPTTRDAVTDAADAVDGTPDAAPTPIEAPTRERTRLPRAVAPLIPLVIGTAVSQPAASLSVAATRVGTTASPEVAADPTESGKTATTRGGARSVRDAVEAAAGQIGAAVTATADTVGRAAARVRGGKAGTADN